jgi:hypothetical protein
MSPEWMSTKPGPEVIRERIIAKMDTYQQRMGSQYECLAKRDYGLPRSDRGLSRKDEGRDSCRLKDIKACLEEAGACLESKVPTSVEIESVAMYEEVPKEEATVKTARALKERYGNQHVALGHGLQLKKRAQGEPRRKLATACRGVTCHARAACHKGRRHTGPTVEQRHWKNRTKDSVAVGTSKGRAFGKTHQAQPECNNGIRDRGQKELLCLGSKRTLNKTFRHTVKLKIGKQTVGTSIRLGKMSDWTLWRGRPPLEQKKRPLTTA